MNRSVYGGDNDKKIPVQTLIAMLHSRLKDDCTVQAQLDCYLIAIDFNKTNPPEWMILDYEHTFHMGDPADTGGSVSESIYSETFQHVSVWKKISSLDFDQRVELPACSGYGKLAAWTGAGAVSVQRATTGSGKEGVVGGACARSVDKWQACAVH